MENANTYLQKKYKSLVKSNAKFQDLPIIYLRVGLPKKVKNKYLPSRNHYIGGLEEGVSVFSGRYSPNSKFVFVDLDNERGFLRDTYLSFQEDMQLNSSKIKVYLLEGNPLINVGADNEILLNTNGLKVIGELNPKKIIEKDEGTPSRKNKSILLFNTETLSGNELKKYPKYLNGGKINTFNYSIGGL